MKVKLLCLVGLFCLMTGCSDDDGGSNVAKERKDIALSRAEEQLADESTDFAFRFFQQVNKSETEKPNWMVSPLSASMTLGMISNGASGNTLEEIKTALGFSNFDLDGLNTYYQKLTTELLDLDNTTRLNIANSIWLNNGFSVYDSFVNVNKNMYGAQVDCLDFASSDAADAINRWCADKTNGKIKEVVVSVPDEISIYLLNALYFKGIWKQKFNSSDTRKEAFNNVDGSTSEVPMMNQQEYFAFFNGDDFSMAEFLYGNGAFGMVVVLPDEGVSLDTVLEELTYENWNEWYAERYSQNLQVKFPRFEMGYEKDLKEDMMNMGIKEAFGDNADFSQMTSSAMRLTILKQYSYLKVNEEGTEAASVTKGGHLVTAITPTVPEPFYMNRPFAFMIKERSTGTVLFMGKVTKL